MMKTKTLQILVLMLLINMLFVRASIDASYECRGKNCMEGTEIDFTVNIYNNINKSINVGDIYIKDKDYGVILGFDIGEKVVLNPNEVHSFNFTSLVKAPVKGYTFYYVPCFRMSYVSKPEEVFEICGKTVKSFTVLPLSKIDCKEDSECDEDEYCNTFSIYKCRKLECNPNETAVNHSCVVLEPKKVVIINWGNVILTAGFVVLAVVLLFLFIGRKQKHEDEDYIDMTAEFNEEEESPKGEEHKEEKLDKEYKKIEESSKELKEDKPKKDEENKEIEETTKESKEPKKEETDKEKGEKLDKEYKKIEESSKELKEEEPKKDELNSHKKEVKEDDEIKKKKTKPKKNNKKKYKRVKQNKTYDSVPDYVVDEQKEETKKTGQETEDKDIEIMDYSGYEDDDEENKDIF